MNTNEPTGLFAERNPVEKDRKKASKIIVGLTGTLALRVEHAFRQMGWRVSAADGAMEARVATQRCKASLVVLPASQFSESGFLTCA